MPKFLEDKLKAEYGAKSKIPFDMAEPEAWIFELASLRDSATGEYRLA